MKTETLMILQHRLNLCDANISNHKESLEIGIKANKENPMMFTKDSVETLRNKIKAFEQKRDEVIACIKWVQSIND